VSKQILVINKKYEADRFLSMFSDTGKSFGGLNTSLTHSKSFATWHDNVKMSMHGMYQ